MPGPLDNLNPDFRDRLSKLMAAAGVTVTDGYRTRAQQADLYRRKPGLAAPPGRSRHERGEAADLTGDLEKAHALAAQFGLSFPMNKKGQGKYEPWHAQMAGNSGGKQMSPLSVQRPASRSVATKAPYPEQSAIPQFKTPQEALDFFYGPMPAASPNRNDVRFLGPSRRDWQKVLEERALAAQPDPNAAAVAEQSSHIDYLKALQDLRGGHPPVQQQPYELPSAVTRETLPFPQREALPQNRDADIATAVLAALFPEQAGNFAASNTGAAFNERGQRDAYNRDKFGYDVRQADQSYDDKTRRQEAEIRNALLNRQISQDNANQQREFDLTQGQVPLEQDQARRVIAALQANTKGQREFNQAQLAASQNAQSVATEDARANAEIAARNELAKTRMLETPKIIEALGLKPLNPLQKAQQAEAAARTQKLSAETKFIPEVHRVTMAKMKADTSLALANAKKALAEAKKAGKKGGGDIPVGVLTAGIQELNKNVELEKQSLAPIEAERRKRYVEMREAAGTADYPEKKRMYGIVDAMVKEQQANLSEAQKASRKLSDEAREIYGLRPIGEASGTKGSAAPPKAGKFTSPGGITFTVK